MKNLISMRDLTKADITKLLDTAAKIESGEILPDLERKVAGLLFLSLQRALCFLLILR